MKISAAQMVALRRAAIRERGNLCPTPGLGGIAQTALVRALKVRGLVTDEDMPYITDAGRAAVNATGDKS